MTEDPSPISSTKKPSIEGRVDEACDRFEAAWKAGKEPGIETFLQTLLEPERSSLFRHLLELELELRMRRGEQPELESYLVRFPGYTSLILEAFKKPAPPGGADVTTSRCPGLGEGTNPSSKRDGIEQQQFTVTQSLLKSTGPEKQIGRYRILRTLGQGAFGRVYLGFDEELHRQVAIKVPNSERFQNEGDADLYLAEARVVATLDHPNIVPVYDVGRMSDGSFYIVSKYIEGPTLSVRVSERAPAEEACRLVATIARALDHAHRKRLIHRDVKPANILIEAASSTPFVADFGLAISEEASLLERKVAGTPAYMSPEQVRGEGHRLDGRSDIFSLGVVFYELLTGIKPFRGSSIEELLHQVISTEPLPPRAMDETVPEELERICLKAISKRATDRYSTAMEMADDLVHWRQDPATKQKQVAVVPRGLRSFGPDDADFFLELLPGSRGRDGLPESLRFWKKRIEETDPEKTFDIGLIYGPSGCGKSSLVKAGLLPNLAKSVVAIYLEATADETEARILAGLRKRLPDLPSELGLIDTFILLRRGGGSTDGRKVVIVMDQFEQWLHARRAELDTNLVTALRQCDGSNLQAIIMVRDDFSMAASRFMRELETPILEGHNFATVDLFDHDHAVKVLTRFGQAFGKLSNQLNNLSASEKSFIDDVAAGLAEDGKVVSVRLSLFAEMVKDKPWIPSTFDEVGGTEGVGVNFLEETFSSRKANPEHRLHQEAARQVLKELLPELGTDIKGHMRSQDQLLAVSGYRDRPEEFRNLVRILDGSLRLITPTDPDGVRSGSGSDSGTKYYQLTHDYLVPSLREWLTRKQKETPQGRAELRLAEITALWSAKPENRRLPGWADYRTLRKLTERSRWSRTERKMMSEAAKYHSHAVVKRLLEADFVDVPKIIEHVHLLSKLTEPLLKKEQQEAGEYGKAKLHTALALLALDETQLDYLYGRLLHAGPGEFPILRDALVDHREKLSTRLWSDVESATHEERRLHAAAALAAYDPGNPRWTKIREDVVQALTRVNPEFLGDWKDALRPVRAELLEPLAAVLRNQDLGELRLALATSTLADYAADDVSLLTDLICDANLQQFAGLFPMLARHGEAAIRKLENELNKVVEPKWADLPADLLWREVSAAVERALEVSAGMLAERFAFCQDMPQSKFRDIIDELGKCGYRPTRIRPYLDGRSVLVAAVWTRDGHPWQWLGDADAEHLQSRDAELRQDGYVATDIAVYCSRKDSPPRYTAVWEQVDIGETEVRLVAGSVDQHAEQTHANLVADKFNCLVANLIFDAERQPHACSLWSKRKDQQKSTTRFFHGPADEFREDDCPSLLLTDAQINRCKGQDEGFDRSALWTTAVWNISTQFESKVLHERTLEDLRELVPKLAVEGFRPVSISVVGEEGRKLRPNEEVAALSTSVWHRPLIPEEAKDRLARRQANAAVALLRLQHDQKVWPILAHRPDPRTRSYLIHRFGPLDADPQQVLAQLDIQDEVSIRRALILVLGEFSKDRFPAQDRAVFMPRLLDLYTNDPDPGIHSAVAWTLRQWGLETEPKSLDQEFATGKQEGSRRWYVNRQGQTLVIIPPPGEILIGSPVYEVGREDGPEGGFEMQRYARIDHAFAVMTHLVTVANFLQFRKDFYYRKYFSPELDCPINNVTWYDAVAYCNWLNEREGIPQNQWCYMPNDKGEYAHGMTIVSDWLQRTGYRLPTEEEWEYACRAGAITSRYYGQKADLDNHYACSVQYSLGRRTTLVGSFKPNDLGLFDMLGNNLEWSQSEFRDPSQPTEDGSGIIPVLPSNVRDQQMRALRGATLVHPPETIRAAFVDGYPPAAGVYGTSLRIGRTCRPHDNREDSSVVKNEHRKSLRGSGAMSVSAFIRASYRIGQKTNMPLFGWGLRATRTLDLST